MSCTASPAARTSRFSLLKLFSFHLCLLPFAWPAAQAHDIQRIRSDPSLSDTQFFSYLSVRTQPRAANGRLRAAQLTPRLQRPDLNAPKWNVTVYDEQALAPGYWFVSIYDGDRTFVNVGNWSGPYIYDQTGELIWSGATLGSSRERYEGFDFKVTQVDGEDSLSFIHPRDCAAIVLDQSYQEKRHLRIGDAASSKCQPLMTNIHDLQIYDKDDELIIMSITRDELDQHDMAVVNFNGSCAVYHNGFRLASLSTGEVLWEWSSDKNIPVSEALVTPNNCERGWDYFHINSVERLPDGDYLVSARHTSTVYKISHKDGAIIWRLNGHNSDFVWIGDGQFLGQHDARLVSHNDTHLLISLLDNAMVPWPLPGNSAFGYPYARGLILALDVSSDPMTVQVVAHYDHPMKEDSDSRGNMELLPGRNVFLDWSERSPLTREYLTPRVLISEHAPNGKLLLSASLDIVVKTYRAYKFPWIGKPNTLPSVHSDVVSVGDASQTRVHVSWNGATEVAVWNLYGGAHRGKVNKLLTSVKRNGFETALTYEGYAAFVTVEALNQHGNRLARSKVVKTIVPSGFVASDGIEEPEQIQDHAHTDPEHNDDQTTNGDTNSTEDMASDDAALSHDNMGSHDEAEYIDESDSTDDMSVDNDTAAAQPFDFTWILALGAGLLVCLTAFVATIIWRTVRPQFYEPLSNDDGAELEEMRAVRYTDSDKQLHPGEDDEQAESPSDPAKGSDAGEKDGMGEGFDHEQVLLTGTDGVK